MIRGFLLKNVSDFADNPVNVSITTLRGLRYDYLAIQSYLSICFSTVPIYHVSLYLTHYLRQYLFLNLSLYRGSRNDKDALKIDVNIVMGEATRNVFKGSLKFYLKTEDR